MESDRGRARRGADDLDVAPTHTAVAEIERLHRRFLRRETGGETSVHETRDRACVRDFSVREDAVEVPLSELRKGLGDALRAHEINTDSDPGHLRNYRPSDIAKRQGSSSGFKEHIALDGAAVIHPGSRTFEIASVHM